MQFSRCKYFHVLLQDQHRTANGYNGSMKRTCLIAAGLLAHGLPQAAPADELARLVNAYRAAPPSCQGKPARAAPALEWAPPLARIRLQPGAILIAALDRVGFDADYADAIEVSGPADAAAAFKLIVQSHCSTLLHPRFRAFGVNQRGAEWTVVLAQPAPDLRLTLADWVEEGKRILAATNAARAQGRSCGTSQLAPAPPLAWNAELGRAALAHSQDMATRRYFAHASPEGRMPADRAIAAGYAYRRVGENIGAGQRSAEDMVAAWVESPGHCVNLMNPAFTDMGAAYAIRGGPRPSAYWTQVFGTR
jgi:uncharacterized protein YkwD